MNCTRLRQRALLFTTGLLISGLALTAAAAPAKVAGLARLSLREAAPRVKVFVELDQEPVAALNISAMQATGALASRIEQQQQALRVVTQQRQFREQLDSLGGAQEIGALRVGANGIILNIDRDKIDALKSLPGVVSVTRISSRHLDNVTSVPWIGAQEVWTTRHIKGEHIKIGILDTGIDYTHANFGGSGNPADYASLDKNVLTPGTFPTAKVKGGIDLVGALYDPTHDPSSTPHPDPNPLDGNGHGSHVAGTAAGFGVPGQIGPGVAPEADLYAVKVFDDLGSDTSSEIVAQGIEWALDPNGDGDMSDHLDVINMSLGGPFSAPTEPDAIEAQRASNLNIVVVASAGNDGPVPYITGGPSEAPAAISVAAAIPGGRIWSRTTVTAPASVAGVKTNFEGAGPVQLQNTGPISGTLVNSVPANGCTPFTNASEIAGKIALVRRGICDFNDKYLAAQAAGARAIVVYNDGADPTRRKPIVMGLSDGTITIPGLMIGSADGFAIAAVATTTAASPVSVTLDVAPDPTRDDQIAPFSSRGPGSGGTRFKPEISAPGFDIVSTGAGTGTAGATLSGTSMAAPHVAGSAALLRELHPNFAPAAIKALLLNSTLDANPSDDTDLARQGVGVLRVGRAAALTALATPGAISFGRVNPESPISLTRPFLLLEFGGRSRSFTVKHVPHRTYPGVTVTCPSSVTIGANAPRTFSIGLSFDPRVARTRGVADDWSQSETEVDGWCVLSEGKDTLRIGYLASVDAASLLSAHQSGPDSVTIANNGPSVGLAQGFTVFGIGAGSSGAGNTLTHVGVRHATVSETDTFQFAVALGKSFEHLSGLMFEMFVDVDNDGVDDVELDGADISVLAPGQPPGMFVTAQFDLHSGEGFLDFPGTWDFNDRAAILTYTTTANAAAPGLVPAKFSYRLHLADVSGNRLDTLRDAVDMSKEAIPDLNDFTLDPGASAKVQLSHAGKTLWFYPGNPPDSQIEVIVNSVKP